MEEIFSDSSHAKTQVKCLSMSIITDDLQKQTIKRTDSTVNFEWIKKQKLNGSEASVVSEEFQRQRARKTKESSSSDKLRNQRVLQPKETSSSVEFQRQISTDPEVSVISEIFQEQSAVCVTALSQNNGSARDINDDLHQVMNSREDFCPPAEDSPKMLMQVVVAFIISLTQFGIGNMNGFPGITLPQLTQPDSDDIFLDTRNAAFFGSFVLLGCLLGGPFSAPIATWLGSRKTMLVTIPLTMALWFLQAFSPNVISLLAARIGLGAMSSFTLPPGNSYILEIAHKDRRGLLFGILQVCRILGIVFISAVGSSSLTWRQLSLICGTVVLVIPFVGLFFFPESPRWLVTKGRVEEAKKSLLVFRGDKYDSQSELNTIIEQAKTDSEEKNNNQCMVLFSKSNIRLFLILIILSIFDSSSGCYVVLSYTVPIFQASGSDLNPYISTILVNSCRVIGTITYAVTVDCLGRKYFLIFSYVMMTIGLALFAACNYLKDIDWVIANLGWLPVTSLMIYTFFLGISQPILFTLHGELLPSAIRQTAIVILNCTFAFGGSITTFLFPIMNENIGEYGTFWTFSICSFLAAVITYTAIPETSGLSLEEISARNVRQNI